MRERDCRANYSSVSRYKRRTVRTRCDPDAARWATLFPHVPLARVPCASKLSNPFQRYRTRTHLLLAPIQPLWSAAVGRWTETSQSIGRASCAFSRPLRILHDRVRAAQPKRKHAAAIQGAEEPCTSCIHLRRQAAQRDIA